MSENEVAKIILDVAFRIHRELGPGLFESVYVSIMEHILREEYRLKIQTQKAIPVVWNHVKLDIGFRVDLIVEEKVIVEAKSIEVLAPVHFKQVLTYLKLTNIKLGLLINFNEELLKNGIRRIVNYL